MAITRITKGVIKPNENYDTHNIVSTGIVTSVGLDVNGNADVSGSLSVGGVLTYEDVTSIDSIGIITARSGIDADDFISVGNNIHLGNAGVITATSFVGSGAALTGIDATAIKDSGGNVKIQAQASGAIHSGVSTFQDIDVDGHTNLDNVSIAGVTTFSDNDIHFKNNGITSCRYDSDLGRFNFNHSGGLQWYKNGNLSNSSGAMIFYSEFANQYKGLVIHAPWQGQNNAKNVTVMGSSNGRFYVQHNLNAQETFSAYFEGGVHLGYYQSGTKLSTTQTGITLYQDLTVNRNALITGISTFTGAIDANGDLDVDGHTNLDNVSVAGVSTFSGILDATNTPASIRVAQDIQHKGDADTKITFPSNDQISFETGGSERVRITDAGRFGIGTNSPGSLFQVGTDTSGKLTFDGANTLAITGPEGGAARIDLIADQGDDAGDKWRIANTSGNEFKIQRTTSHTDTFVIDASGEVGINESSPDRDLVVRGSTNATIKIKAANTHTSQLFFSDTDAENPARISLFHGTGQTTSGHLLFDVGGNTVLTLKSDQNILHTKASANPNFTLSRNASIGNDNQTIGVIDFASNTAHTVQARIMAKNHGTNNVGGYLVVETREEGGSLTEKVRITGMGDIYAGNEDGYAIFDNSTTRPRFQFRQTTGTNRGTALIETRGDANSMALYIAKSRGGNGTGVINSGDQLGTIQFTGADGTNQVTGAQILAYTSGTIAADRIPTNLSFYTHPDSTAGKQERLRIKDDGVVLLPTTGKLSVGTTNPVARFQVGPANGSRQIEIEEYGVIRGYDRNSNAWAQIDFEASSYSFDCGGTERWTITSGGHFVPGANDTYDIGDSSNAVRNIYTGDLHLNNLSKEKGNDVDGTNGSWTIQEGQDDLYIINKLNGKKYRIPLEEVN